MIHGLPPALQLGPLTLPIGRLALIVGILLALRLVRSIATRQGFDGRAASNMMAESVLLGVAAAFAAPLVLDTREALAHPLTAMFGGFSTLAIWLGIGIGLLALAWKNRTVCLPLPLVLDQVVAASLLAWAVYSLGVDDYGSKIDWIASHFQKEWYHPLFLYRAFLLLTGCAWVTQKASHSFPGGAGAGGLIGIGWMLLLLSTLQPPEHPAFWLTGSQWGGILLALSGILLRIIFRPGSDIAPEHQEPDASPE